MARKVTEEQINESEMPEIDEQKDIYTTVLDISPETEEAAQRAMRIVGKTFLKAIFTLYNTTEVLLRARNPELSNELAAEKEKFLAEYAHILKEDEGEEE